MTKRFNFKICISLLYIILSIGMTGCSTLNNQKETDITVNPQDEWLNQKGKCEHIFESLDESHYKDLLYCTKLWLAYGDLKSIEFKVDDNYTDHSIQYILAFHYLSEHASDLYTKGIADAARAQICKHKRIAVFDEDTMILENAHIQECSENTFLENKILYNKFLCRVQTKYRNSSHIYRRIQGGSMYI